MSATILWFGYMNYRSLWISAITFSLALFQTGFAFAEPAASVSAPVSIQLIGSIALIVCVAILAYVIWNYIHNKNSGADFPYKDIESSALDSNPKLCEQFYTAAFDFRAEHGHKKYQSAIVNKHKFFYDFHNKALKLIDDLFTQTPSFQPSIEFVIATIKSGHIGNLYTDINYEGGIEDQRIAPHTACIAYANTDSIDIWTSQAPRPVCVLTKKQMELTRPNKVDGYVTAELVAEHKNTYQIVRVRLGFPDFKYNPIKEQVERHEIMATQNYHQLEKWLKKHAPKHPKALHANFGIAVEHGYDVDYGIPAPELMNSQTVQPNFLSQALQMLKRKKIDAYFTRYDMPIVKSKSAMDALVLCSGLGLVIITEQHTTGSVSFNGEAGWIVEENDRTQIIENACLQAEKAKKSVLKLLEMRGLEQWPVTCLVVFSANDVELVHKPSSVRLQCDVIRLSELDQWFSSNSMINKVKFTKDDYNRLALLLGKKARQYTADLKEA